MFARNVRIQLKPNTAAEFTRLLEKDVIPALRKQKGFQDEITFFIPGGKEAVGISLWERREDAETYNRGAYGEVMKSLASVVEGTPRVETCEVSNSTFHKIATPVTV